MRTNVKTRWSNLVQSQRGAALLMVLLVTVFVVIMGSSVMFTSYNGYIMRLVDREGVDTFYDTEELTDLVRVSVQDAASDALQTAYTRVMSEYAFIQAEALFDEDAVQEAAQNKFNEYFIEELARYYTSVPQYDSSGNPVDDGSGSQSTANEHLFQVDQYTSTGVNLGSGATGSVTGSMSTTALQGILSAMLGDGDVTVTGGDTAISNSQNGATGTDGATIVYPFDNGGTATTGVLGAVANFTYTYGDDGYPRLVIKDVTVSYVTDGGYETNITTDIIIEMPMFIHTGDISSSNWEEGTESMESSLGLPFDNASSIGKLWVKTSTVLTGGGLLVTGDIYGGSFLVYNESSDPRDVVFSHGSGRLITHNGSVPVGDTESGNVGMTGLAVDGVTELDGIIIHEGTSFTSQSDSEIWTNSVSVREGSDLVLAGERDAGNAPYYYIDPETGEKIQSTDVFGGTFIKKDIEISGGIAKGEVDVYGNSSGYNNISNIVLSGDLYGISMGTTAETSSAIVMNGDDINLDMSGLKEILLGGTTYLQVGRATGFKDESGSSLNTNDEYEMGQSIASTPDALAYMVPYYAIEGVSITSNPAQIDGTFTGTTIDFDVLPDWVDDYVQSSPQVISRTYGDTRLVYFFYQFDDDTKRAGFIENYITNTGDGEDFEGYFENNLSLFVNMTDEAKLEAASAAAGVVYYMGTDGLKVMNTTLSDVDKATLTAYEKAYENTAVTLWPNQEICPSVPSTGYATYDLDLKRSDGRKIELQFPDNPFDYYVNMRGDNLYINYEYTYNGGTNLNNDGTYTDVTGLSTNGKTADLWEYFDHDSDGEYGEDSVYSPIAGYDADKPNENVRRIGLAEWCTKTGIPGSVDDDTIFEFKIGDDVVAIYKSNGLIWGNSAHGTTSEDYPHVKMLLSRSGILIGAYTTDYFKGLAFSETGIALIGRLDSYDQGFESIMTASCVHPYTGDVKYLYEFFRNLNLTSEGGSAGEDGSEPVPGVSEDDAKVNWSPNDLVYYENWERH